MIHIIGIAGAHETTLRAARAIRSVRVLVGSARQLGLIDEIAPDHDAERVAYKTLDDLRAALDRLLPLAGDVGLLASGDPSFYGITPFIRRSFPEVPVTVYPGVSSAQLLFSRLALPMHDIYMSSVHGRNADFDSICAQKRVCLLTDQTHTARAVAAEYASRGLDLPMYIGSYLGYPSETLIRTTTFAAARDSGFDRFSFAVVAVGDFGEPLPGAPEGGTA